MEKTHTEVAYLREVFTTKPQAKFSLQTLRHLQEHRFLKIQVCLGLSEVSEEMT